MSSKYVSSQFSSSSIFSAIMKILFITSLGTKLTYLILGHDFRREF